jgi:hypothetical protein
MRHKIHSILSTLLGTGALSLMTACGSSDVYDDGLERTGQVSEAVVDQQVIANGFEPHLAVSPTNPLVVAGAMGNTVQVSTNGGISFLAARPANPPAGVGGNGDSVLTFDGLGRLWWTFLGNLDVYVTQVNTTTGIPIGTASNASTGSGQPTGTSDKQWIAADRFATSPFQNNIYVVFWDGQMRFTRSTNGGVSWSPRQTLSNAADNTVRMADVAVGRDGAVYVAYHSAVNSSSTNENPDGTTGRIVVRRSDDGGVTFPAANKWNAYAAGAADMSYNFQFVCTTPGPGGTCTSGTNTPPRRLDRNQNIMIGSAQPILLPDPTNANNLAIIASDDPTNTSHGAAFDDASVFIARSTNRGVNWTAPSKVDGGTGTSLQFMPMASTDVNSQCLAVSYYDNRTGVTNANGNLLLDMYVRGSTNGGVSWGPEVRINDARLDPDLNAGGIWVPNPPLPPNYVFSRRIGEYNGVGLAGGVAHANWTGNDVNGFQAAFYDNIRVCNDPTIPPPNGHVAAARQSTAITAVFSVGTDGALYRRWVSGTGAWQGPSAITGPNFAPPGAPLATFKPTATELDVFVVGNDGAVRYVFETNDGPWQIAPALSAAGFASPGAHLATGLQNGIQQDLFVVDTAGTLQAFGRILPFAWSGNIPIAANFAPSGAPLATGNQGSSQLDVFGVASNGAVRVTWVNGFGAFNPPLALAPAGTATPGAHLATGMQGTNQLDLFYTTTTGAINVNWVVGTGFWFGPLALTSTGFTTSTAGLSTGAQGSTLNVFAVNNNGALNRLSVVGTGAWSGPIALSPNGQAQAGADTSAATQSTNLLDAFVVGNLWLLETTNNGSWQPIVPRLP